MLELGKNPLLTAKALCRLLGLDYEKYCDYVTHLRSVWKHDLKNRHALKCLSFHAARGWVFALGSVDRGDAVNQGWVLSRARNHMLVFKDLLGRLEWHVNGRVNFWVKKPATWGRVLQLLAKGFTWTGLIRDVEVFELWARSAKFRGAHLTYDLGERLPYARIEYLKDALGVVVKTGDVTHPTAIEIEFCYPDWAERNERLLQSLVNLMKNGGGKSEPGVLKEPSYRV